MQSSRKQFKRAPFALAGSDWFRTGCEAGRHACPGADDTGVNVSPQAASGPAPGHHFVGTNKAGTTGPGNERADDDTVAVRSSSSLPVGAAQSVEPTGSRVAEATTAHAAADSLSQPRRLPTMEEIHLATLRQAAVQAYRALVQAGCANRAAARQVGHPFHTLRSWGLAYDRAGFDGLLPKTANSGRKPMAQFSQPEINAVKALVLQTNRNATSGSTPEALRVALKRGLLSPENAALVQARLASGKRALPGHMANQVRVPVIAIQSARAPRNAWLRHVESPGSLYLAKDAQGREYEIQPGMRGTIDDGTINFVCCVPMNLPGNPCSEKFGVMVGRFQFLLPVDHRSHFITGFNYTARPRSSYRAEDLTATLHTAFAEHGCWPEMVLENGVSASQLLTDTLRLLRVKIIRASSPHQKVVEGVFNKLWTKLSLLPGQVGRFMGEEEEINALLVSCRRGATDPRKYFPALADVLPALHEAIAEHNSQLVKSRQAGNWVPAEYFARCARAHLRPLRPEQAWMFSPVITGPLTVRGFKVRKTVCLMEGYSEAFDFQAEFLGEFTGALVKLYFNPFAPECVAMVELAEDFGGRKAGTILGHAEQTNRLTRFRRRALGYGADPDIGRDAARRMAQALRRSSVAIRINGTAGAQIHEARTGAGELARVTNLPPPATSANRRGLALPTAQEIAQQTDRFERLAARQRQLQQMTVSDT